MKPPSYEFLCLIKCDGQLVIPVVLNVQAMTREALSLYRGSPRSNDKVYKFFSTQDCIRFFLWAAVLIATTKSFGGEPIIIKVCDTCSELARKSEFTDFQSNAHVPRVQYGSMEYTISNFHIFSTCTAMNTRPGKHSY